MTNWRPKDPSLYQDVQSVYSYAHSMTFLPRSLRLKRQWRSARDSARTPVQWTDGTNAGFTDGTPWISVNENYKEINVEKQENDPDSLLNFYRRVIELRKTLPVVKDGEYIEYNKLSSHFYVYERKNKDSSILVIASFSKKARRFTVPSGIDLSKGKLILSNYNDCKSENTFVMRPYEVRVYSL